LRTFHRAVVVLAVLFPAVMVASPATAVKRCPPLPVNAGDACSCTVANYGTTNDTGVAITVYNFEGIPVNACSSTSIPAKGSRQCNTTEFVSASICNCEVTGEGGAARVSLSVLDSSVNSASASVECR
jgi:hypothetical protein